MFKVCLFGAGKIGEAISGLLGTSGNYKVIVCDHSLSRAQLLANMWPNCEAQELDLSSKEKTLKLLSGVDAVISALPFHCNINVSNLAFEAGVHYFDLTEDVETAKHIKKLADDPKSKSCFMPQCGLAPGFISIASMHLAKTFDSLDTVKMRVGALPIYPSNRLKYNLTWSTEGLINEYGNDCEVIENGKKISTLALEGYERFSLDGAEYEAFNTSGGLGSLCDTLQGKVRKLNYKSVRYPGHRDLIAFLMHDLGFNSDRETLRKVFERSISTTAQDKCIIFCEVAGTSRNRFIQRTYASTVYNTTINDHHFGAIQITTASGICAPLDLLLTGKISKKTGFLRSEEISLLDFIENQFGKYYKDEKALHGILA
jgi:saccharopine dehydrogenase-like NADP-dependent oxidoreductase